MEMKYDIVDRLALDDIEGSVNSAFEYIYNSIPQKEKISKGRVYVIKVIGSGIYKKAIEDKLDIERLKDIFEKATSYKAKGALLEAISMYGKERPQLVFDTFELAAGDDSWDVREMSAIMFRKVIKSNKDICYDFLYDLTKSQDPMIRRFVSETLRPVVENKWLFNNIDYSISILKNMFKEPDPYPRTSVGNNLSDISKKLPDVVFDIVRELVGSGDKNSYWIAYRACRNLVKKYTKRVLDILGIEEYKYKKNIYRL